jgi:hypothetical protein
MPADYDDRKVEEAVENGMPVYDLSGSGDLEETYTSHDEVQPMEEVPYLSTRTGG